MAKPSVSGGTKIPVVDASGRRNGVNGRNSLRWWAEVDPGPGLYEHAKQIDSAQNFKRVERLIWAKLYTEQNVSQLYQIGASSPASGDRGDYALGMSSPRLSYNVVQMAINTVWAKIAKSRPRIRFLTTGGNYSQQRRAKGLTKFADGIFYKTGLWNTVGPMAFRDSQIWGTGAIKFTEEDNDIVADRTMIDELLFDENEALYGHPRTLYQRWYLHRDVLLERFGGKKLKLGTEEIDTQQVIEAARGQRPGRETQEGDGDMLLLYEAWHLPSNADKTDGRHAFVLDGWTIGDSPWKKSYFPFARTHWEDPVVGMWGRGTPELLAGIQVEIQKCLRTIQRTHDRVTIPRVFYEGGADMAAMKLNNEVGAMYRLPLGGKVYFEPGPDVNPGIYQHLEDLYRKALELVGVSMMNATGAKPAGLNSAPAQREYADITSERFVLQGQKYEQLFVDAADICIEMARDLAERGKPIQVNAPGARGIESIKWEDVDLKRDAYIMQPYPTSTMPTTPAARLEWIEERVKSGWLSKDEAMMLADFPDLDSVTSLQTSGMRTIMALLEKMVDDGEYQAPEPGMNLQLATKYAQDAALKARLDGVPQAHIDVLYRFATECAEIANKEAPPAAPLAPGPAMLPPMAPGLEALPPGIPGAPLPPMAPALPAMA